jgi:hypothetical protein
MTSRNYSEDIHEDARTWRIFRKNPDGGTFLRPEFDVLAVYYKEEDGFLVFKDCAHKPVYAVSVDAVEEVVRLRTDTVLAVSERTLKDIVESLGEYAMRLDCEAAALVKEHKGTPLEVDKGFLDRTAAKVKRLQETAVWLRRGEGIAADRREEDPYSLEAVPA